MNDGLAPAEAGWSKANGAVRLWFGKERPSGAPPNGLYDVRVGMAFPQLGTVQVPDGTEEREFGGQVVLGIQCVEGAMKGKVYVVGEALWTSVDGVARLARETGNRWVRLGLGAWLRRARADWLAIRVYWAAQSREAGRRYRRDLRESPALTVRPRLLEVPPVLGDEAVQLVMEWFGADELRVGRAMERTHGALRMLVGLAVEEPGKWIGECVALQALVALLTSWEKFPWRERREEEG
jgi:hypothetical protein